MLQVNATETAAMDRANMTLDQIEIILDKNEVDSELLTESLKEGYIIRAQTAAFIVQNMNMTEIEDLQEVEEMLQIDEIHFFNTDGVIYAGTEPQYYGLSFDSGEQMSFFKPLLDDKSLVLCQDITPNTGENKPMIYAGVWREDGSGIVQIGLEPHRLIEAQEKNALDYIFSTMPTSNSVTLYAIDKSNGYIVGCSENILLNRSAKNIGIDLSLLDLSEDFFYTKIEGVSSICVFREYGDTIIGFSQPESLLDATVTSSMVLVVLYLGVAAVVMILSILYIIERSILHNIDLLIDKLKVIANGNLDTKVNIVSSPEFLSLSRHLNSMVSSLLNTTTKLSKVFEVVDVQIAVYEYKSDMNRVLATRRISELLMISDVDMAEMLTDKVIFEEKLNEIRKNVIDAERNIYRIECKQERYVEIETFSDENDEFGVILDVTDDILEKHQLEYERDYDLLTEMLNRRGFYRKVDEIMEGEVDLKHAVMIAFDTDNLKGINDEYGHAGGDVAIQKSAEIIKNIKAEHKLVARLGGDEFEAFIYGAKTKEELIECILEAEKIAQNTCICVNGVVIPLKMSAGYQFFPDETVDYNEIMKCADNALYEAKRNGKSRFCEYLL